VDESEQSSLRSDVTLFLSTKGKGQWFTSDQLYDAMGMRSRVPSMPPVEFTAFLEGMAARKILKRWRAEPNSVRGEMFGVP
jgi:hypothetical protein